MKRLPPIEIWLLILVIVVGLGLRLYGLGAKSLWYDEIYIFHAADKGIKYIANEFSYKYFALRQSPINLFIVHLSLRLCPNEFFLRFPAALWGTLGVLGTYLLGKAFFGKQEGLLGAFLLAISSFHIRYSQEARMYSLLLFTSLLANYFFWRALLKSKKREWLGYIVWSVISIYTHMFAIFLILSQMAYFGLGYFRKFFKQAAGQWERKRVVFLLSLLIIAAASSPRLIKVVQHMTTSTQPWVSVSIGAVSQPTGSVRFTPIPILLGLYGAGRGFPLALYLSFFMLGFLGSLKRTTAAVTYLSLVLILPFLTFVFIKPTQIFSPRYLIFLLPIYYIVIARGITSLIGLPGVLFGGARPRAQRYWRFMAYAVVIGGFLSCSARPLRMYYLESRDPDGRLFKFDWKGVAAFLEDNVEAGDLIVTCGPTAYYDRVCLRQYLSPSLQEKIVGVGPEETTGCRIWRLGRNYGPRNASSDAREEFLSSPVTEIAISRALHPVDLKLKETIFNKSRSGKIPVQPGKIFKFSVLVKGAECHYEGFSPCVPINFYDSASQLVQVPDRAIMLVVDREDGWKYYLLGGLTPPTAEYATVSFHKRRAHVGDEFELADGKFYGDWDG